MVQGIEHAEICTAPTPHLSTLALAGPGSAGLVTQRICSEEGLSGTDDERQPSHSMASGVAGALRLNSGCHSYASSLKHPSPGAMLETLL
jgi:hypothetical protein